MSLAIWLVAPLIGLLLSLFAAGGGLVTVPLLNLGLGMPLKQAIATSLLLVAAISALALMQQKRWQLIEWRLHRFFAIGGMSGGFIGASIGLRISDTLQALLFATLVLCVAWWMHSHPMKRVQAYARSAPCDCRYSLLAGLASGLITGLLGVGGGFIMVPLLMMLGVPNHQTAVAHSLVLIISSSLVASLRYYEHLSFVWQPVLGILLLAAAGAWLGGKLSGRLSADRLQRAFSLVLCLLAGWMLLRMP